MLLVPWPLATATFCTPLPGVALQVNALLSSLPVRLTLNGAAFWKTVAIGFTGGGMGGGLLTTTPHGCVVEEVLRGFGAATEKSAELLSVSLQPLLFRIAAVVLLSVGGAVPSEQFVLPKPTMSTTVPPVGQAPVSAVVELTSATLPAVPLMFVVPVASGAGRFVVPPVPAASWIR